MNTYEYQKIRGIKRKLYLIDLRGGCCERCGYDKNLSAFDFHHLDPTKKESQLDMRTLSNSSMEFILNEFNKCELLCSNCHREEHSPDLEIVNIRKIVETVTNNTTNIKIKGKPKCIDCGKQINYTYKICKECSNIKKRKVNRPKLEILKYEVNENGKTWCANKYNVSITTIRRWLTK